MSQYYQMIADRGYRTIAIGNCLVLQIGDEESGVGVNGAFLNINQVRNPDGSVNEKLIRDTIEQVKRGIEEVRKELKENRGKRQKNGFYRVED